LISDNDQASIEDEFSKSWDGMEQLFALHNTAENKSMLTLIADLRAQGYDRQFRAGQQLTTFILSRSRKHGLRGGQAQLSIFIDKQGGMTVRYYDSDTLGKIEVERAGLIPEIELWLKRLLAHPID
jgi:hypothetical protein